MSKQTVRKAETETVIRQLVHLYDQTRDADEALSQLRERLGDEYGQMLSDLDALRHGNSESLSRLGVGFGPERWAVDAAREHGGHALTAFLRMRAALRELGGRLREQWAGLSGFAVYAFFILGYAAFTAIVYFSFVAPTLQDIFARPVPEVAWALSLAPRVLAVVLFALGLVMLGFAVTVFVARSRGTRLARMGPVMERLPLLGAPVRAYHDLLDARSASVLTASGLEPSTALDHAVARGSDRRRDAWRSALNGDGRPAQDPTADLFRALAVANRAGTMTQELAHQSEEALARFEDLLDRARQFFVPVFYVILGLTVALLVIGIYVPIFKLGALF